MPTLNISNTQVGTSRNTVPPFKVEEQDTTPQEHQTPRIYYNTKWKEQYGYYLAVPDLKRAADSKAIWIVGQGWTCENTQDKIDLENIKGIGNDNFTDILKNMIVTASIGQDSFAEIIRRDDKSLLNLKPLNPGKIGIKYSEQGMITGYEQKTTKQGGKEIKRHMDIKDVFHMPNNNRMGDEIHATSDIAAMQKLINQALAFQEIEDKMMLHQVRPMILWKLKTDKNGKITTYINRIEKARKYSDDMYIPDDENIVSWEIINTPIPSGIDTYKTSQRNGFWRAFGLPQIVPGASGESTESESKGILLSFEQTWRDMQRFVEEQVFDQLGIRIKLSPAPSLQPDLQQDEKKDKNQGLEFQPNDVQAGVGR